MKTMTTLRSILTLAVLLTCASGPATIVSAQVKVVATTPSLAALAREVGGAHVRVTALARPNQDPHFVDGRPNFVVALHRADLLVHVGLGLEAGWLPPLLTNARNSDIQPGRSGNLEAATVIGSRLAVPRGQIDRRMGDVHGGGNPHFLYDPRHGVRVAQAIAERLAQIDADHAPAYRQASARFAAAMNQRIQQWEQSMAPHRGQPFVGYHRSTVYLASWLGLEEAGFIEPVPGISPNPRHLARLILAMRQNGVRVVISEPWYNAQNARVVAERSGARFVRLPGGVGVSGVDSYAALIDRMVQDLRQGLSGD